MNYIFLHNPLRIFAWKKLLNKLLILFYHDLRLLSRRFDYVIEEILTNFLLIIAIFKLNLFFILFVPWLIRHSVSCLKPGIGNVLSALRQVVKNYCFKSPHVHFIFLFFFFFFTTLNFKMRDTTNMHVKCMYAFKLSITSLSWYKIFKYSNIIIHSVLSFPISFLS